MKMDISEKKEIGDKIKVSKELIDSDKYLSKETQRNFLDLLNKVGENYLREIIGYEKASRDITNIFRSYLKELKK